MPKNHIPNKNSCHSNSTNINTSIFRDYYFVTGYTATTVNKITKMYSEVKDKMICQLCNANNVDTKLDIKDTYNPTFVIMRKKYCLLCWLQKVKLNC